MIAGNRNENRFLQVTCMCRDLSGGMDLLMKKKNARFLIPFTVGALFLGVTGVIFTVNAAESQSKEVIADNVSIGGIDVSGMTRQQAEDAIEAEVEAHLEATFFLTTEADKTVQVSGTDLGLCWGNTDVVEDAMTIGHSGNVLKRYKEKKELETNGKQYSIVYDIDEETATAYLTQHASELGEEKQNNGLVRQDGTFVLTEGHSGMDLDVEASVSDIQEYISSEWDGEEATISLTVVVSEPEGTAEELAKIQDVLGSFNTDFSTSSEARIKNIENAVSFINGTVLYPGEEFSVADAIYPLDASNGYELAGAYENGTTVESYGGGVCQVSTTLYNAVLAAELEVTQRSNHSMLVSYVDPSRDAAIAGDYKDFKFKNNQDVPIYIEGYCEGKNLYFNIYGQETRDANRVVTFESEIISEAARTFEFTATANPIGYIATTESAHIAKQAELWKIVTVDGVEESREVINTSKYNGTPQKVDIGIASDSAEATNALTSAIATGDPVTVYNAVAQYTTDAAAAANAQAKASAISAEYLALAQKTAEREAANAAEDAAASGTSTATEDASGNTTSTTEPVTALEAEQ